MDNEGVKEIADLARSAGEVRIIEITEGTIRKEPIRLAAVPNGDGDVSLVSIKGQLDEWRTAPERIKGTAKALTINSFVDLVNRHRSGASAVFGNLDIAAPSLTGVIDYHGTDHAPAWAGHRVTYAFPISEEWKAWRAQNGKAMSQLEWANFIEEHIADLSAPMDQEQAQFKTLFGTTFASPSDLITMSRGLDVKVEARVKEHRVLQSGETEITYDESHNDARGKKLVVPGLFVINIPFFVGGERDRIICRLRYRVRDGSIVWFYQMYQADVVVREFLERTLIDVGERTALPTFEATPEA